MKQKIVGVYEAGFEQIQIVLREGDGAEFYLLPETGSLPRMKLGADGDWKDMINKLLHESMEFFMEKIQCRFYPCNDLAHNSAAYVFVMNHQQFADCCAKAGELLSTSLPDLATAWKAWNKATRK